MLVENFQLKEKRADHSLVIMWISLSDSITHLLAVFTFKDSMKGINLVIWIMDCETMDYENVFIDYDYSKTIVFECVVYNLGG